MSKIPAVIFDLDGVLIDSVGINWCAYNTVLKQDYGVMVASADLYKYVGLTLDTQIRLLSKDFNININPDEFSNKTALIKNKMFQELKPMLGVKELLDKLKKNNIKIAIGTSSNKEQAKLKLTNAGILSYFNTIITEDDVDDPKPSPDVYLKCAIKLGVVPRECIVFEDAPNGIASAHSAHMKCIAIKTPYVAPENLNKADLIVENLTEVDLSVIAKLL